MSINPHSQERNQGRGRLVSPCSVQAESKGGKTPEMAKQMQQELASQGSWVKLPSAQSLETPVTRGEALGGEPREINVVFASFKKFFPSW